MAGRYARARDPLRLRPGGPGRRHDRRHRPRRRRRPPHRHEPAGRHGRGRGGQRVRPRPLSPRRRQGSDGQRRPVAGEHRPRPGDGPRGRARPDCGGDGRRPPRLRHGRARGMACRPGPGADRAHRHLHGPERRARGRHASHRQRAVRRSLDAAGAGLPRRPRRPVRRGPSAGRLQDRSRGGQGAVNGWVADQTEQRIPELLAAGDRRRPDAPRARQRHLPQGGVAVPVRGWQHEPGPVHDPAPERRSTCR